MSNPARVLAEVYMRRMLRHIFLLRDLQELAGSGISTPLKAILKVTEKRNASWSGLSNPAEDPDEG